MLLTDEGSLEAKPVLAILVCTCIVLLMSVTFYKRSSKKGLLGEKTCSMGCSPTSQTTVIQAQDSISSPLKFSLKLFSANDGVLASRWGEALQRAAWPSAVACAGEHAPDNGLPEAGRAPTPPDLDILR